MSALDDVLERLVNEPTFKDHMISDPVSALAGYDLDASDIEVLAAQVSGDAGDGGGVEARQSKSALVGLLTQVLEVGSSMGGPKLSEVGFNPQPEPPADPMVPPEPVVPDAGVHGFNPQPEPPPEVLGPDTNIQGFNPQPEPPPESFGGTPPDDSLSQAMGNPPDDNLGATPPDDNLPAGAPGEEEGIIVINGQPEAHKVAPSPTELSSNQRMGISPQPFSEANEAMGIEPTPFSEADEAMGIDPEPFQDGSEQPR